MIQTREQRKKTTLMQRRLIAIVISLVLAVVLLVATVIVVNFSENVIYFNDLDTVDAEGNAKDPTQYIIKKENGVFALYDKDGNICPTIKPYSTSATYYSTVEGTLLDIDAETGEYKIKVVPDNLYKNEGEHLSESLGISVFKALTQKQLQSVEVHNQTDSYKITRFDLNSLTESATGTFVIEGSPLSTLNKDLLSYFVYIAGYPVVNERLDNIEDFSKYGLEAETRYTTDENGNKVAYEYKPTYYIIKTTNASDNERRNETHKIIIGDMLIDGSGYYLAYEDANGNRRPAVYIFKPVAMTEYNDTSFEKTILANAKDLIVPYLIYPVTANDYYDVRNFTVNHRVNGALQQKVGFSYIDLEDRTGTIYGIHPYVFMETSFKGYYPNYDNIDSTLAALMDPNVIRVAVLSPTNEDKTSFGIMDKIVNADGTVSYMYNSEYTISFDRSIAVEGTEDKLDVKQTLYISKKNESGNYYVFTEIHFLDATAESLLQGITLDTICEVSESSLKCLTFLADDWIYPSFAEININHTQKIEIFSNGYNAEFDLITSSLGNNVSVMQIQYMDNKTNQKYATFHGISFKDKQGNSWYITPASVKVYAKNGTELKPSTRKYDHNAYGEQVQVMDGYAEAVDGTKVYVSADYVTVISGGAPEYYLRYENTSFKKLFGTITSMKIAEGYEITSDDEKALLADKSKHQLTVKITNTENEVFTYNFYELTARKSYLTIGEGDEQVGGFYVQATKVAKILNDVERFFNGELINPDAHK